MKKALALVLMLVFAQNGRAQTYGGFKGGLNICSFTGPGVINGASTLTSGNVGIFEIIPLSRAVNIQVEPTFSWEGETYQPPYGGSGSFKFDYINVPLLLRLTFSGVYLESGPQGGVLISAKQSIKYASGAATSSDYSTNVQSINYGCDFGIGYTFSKILSLGFRYNLGLSNLGQNTQQQAVYKHSVISFNAFFCPDFKHRGK